MIHSLPIAAGVGQLSYKSSIAICRAFASFAIAKSLMAHALMVGCSGMS